MTYNVVNKTSLFCTKIISRKRENKWSRHLDLLFEKINEVENRFPFKRRNTHEIASSNQPISGTNFRGYLISQVKKFEMGI